MAECLAIFLSKKGLKNSSRRLFNNYKVAFYELERQFSLRVCVVGDGDRVDGLEPVPVGVEVDGVDDRGVALPGRDRQLLKPSS